MSRLRFDHLVHWIPTLAQGSAAYESIGFHVAPGGVHPGWGTHNALSHFGLAYVELVAFHDAAAGTTLPPIFTGGPDQVAAGGGASNFAIAVDDLVILQKRLAKQGIRLSDPVLGQRKRPDGALLTWQTATLADGPAWRPFFIQWGVGDAERLADLRSRGIDRPHPGGYRGLCHITITTADAHAHAAWIGEIVRSHPMADDDGWLVPLSLCSIRLRSGDLERIEALAVNGNAVAAHTCFGLQIKARPE